MVPDPQRTNRRNTEIISTQVSVRPVRSISLLWVCAVQRRRFAVGASPTRQTLRPEAIGAVMEVTKWLKPSISVYC